MAACSIDAHRLIAHNPPMTPFTFPSNAARERAIELIAAQAVTYGWPALLQRAELARYQTEVDLSPPTSRASRNLVTYLQAGVGLLPGTDTPALVELLRVARTNAAGIPEDAAFLDDLLAPYVGQAQANAGEHGRSARPGGAGGPVPVLLLAANPRNTDALRLGDEARSIDARLREAEHRDRIDLRYGHAVRWEDLSGLFLRHQPHVVHFSGHGDRMGALQLEDAAGQAHAVPPEAVAELFRILKGDIRLVVLNACWSDAQAEAIAQHIDVVVGMTRKVLDDVAIRFAAGFYRCLGYAQSVQTAFDLGLNEVAGSLDAGDAPLHAVQRIRARPGVDPAHVFLIEP
jgi:hypothetical protein